MTGGLNGKFEEVSFAGLAGLGDGLEYVLNFLVVAVCFELVEADDLGFADGGVVHLEGSHGCFFLEAIFVDADDGVLAGINAGLFAGSGFFDAHFGQAGFDGFCHATQCFYFLNEGPSFVCQFVGEVFDIVGSAPRVNDFADVGFFLEIYLSVASNTGREIRWEGDGFVEGVGVEGLGVTEGGTEGFDTGSGDVVEGVLFGEAPTGGLAMGA